MVRSMSSTPPACGHRRSSHPRTRPRPPGTRSAAWGCRSGGGRGQRAHAVLDLAHVGVDRHQREADPAGHLRDADRDRTRRRDIARAGLPCVQSTACEPRSGRPAGAPPASSARTGTRRERRRRQATGRGTPIAPSAARSSWSAWAKSLTVLMLVIVSTICPVTIVRAPARAGPRLRTTRQEPADQQQVGHQPDARAASHPPLIVVSRRTDPTARPARRPRR
jgi:hypothetical protein